MNLNYYKIGDHLRFGWMSMIGFWVVYAVEIKISVIVESEHCLRN